MPRLKLTLAYEGTRYAGWQMQAAPKRARGNGGTPEAEMRGPVCPAQTAPTIQGELERAVSAIIGARHAVLAAGRTDAGVHAEAQVCHLDLPEEAVRINWQKALNVMLPPDIRVTGASWTGPDFHARKSAKAKRYGYSLWMRADRALPRVQAFVWSVPAFDPARLAPAVPLLTGERDFASFRNRGAPLENTRRTLFSISVVPGMVGPLACPPEWPVLALVFEGDGFLKQMVRNLAGLLVWIGLGKLEAAAVPAIFAARDRRALPSPAAPARGLTLMEVMYEV